MRWLVRNTPLPTLAVILGAVNAGFFLDGRVLPEGFGWSVTAMLAFCGALVLRRIGG